MDKSRVQISVPLAVTSSPTQDGPKPDFLTHENIIQPEQKYIADEKTCDTEMSIYHFSRNSWTTSFLSYCS